MKKFLPAVLLFLILFLCPSFVFASDLSVSCDSSACTPDSSDPLFPSDPWYPGKSVSRLMNVANNDSSNHSYAVKAKDSRSQNGLADMMRMTITDLALNNALWSGTLQNFYNLEKVELGNINAREAKDFVFLVSFQSVADNQYQNQSTSYNLVIGFDNDTNPNNPSPTNTPDPTTTPTPGQSSSSSPSSTPTPTTAILQVTYVSNDDFVFDTPTPIPSPTGTVLGETVPTTTSGLSCTNPPWGYWLIFVQIVFSFFLLKNTSKKTLWLVVANNFLLTTVCCLFFSLFFCSRIFFFIPIFVNIITLSLVYLRLRLTFSLSTRLE